MVNPSDYLSKAVQLLKASGMQPMHASTEQLAQTLSGASSMETLLPFLLPQNGVDRTRLQNSPLHPPWAMTPDPNGSMGMPGFSLMPNPNTEFHHIQSENVQRQPGFSGYNGMDPDSFSKLDPPIMFSEPASLLTPEEGSNNRGEKRCKIELDPGVVLGVPAASCHVGVDCGMEFSPMANCTTSIPLEAQPVFPEDLVSTMRGTPTLSCKHACQPYLPDSIQGNG